jgi:hypothetical protein
MHATIHVQTHDHAYQARVQPVVVTISLYM